MRQEKRAGLPSAAQMGDRQALSRAFQSKELRDVIQTKINLKKCKKRIENSTKPHDTRSVNFLRLNNVTSTLARLRLVGALRSRSIDIRAAMPNQAPKDYSSPRKLSKNRLR